MTATIPWIAGTLGLTIVAFLALGVWTLLAFRARSVPLSMEERAERADLPMTPVQKAAWWGLGIGLGQAAIILAVFLFKGGPHVYWEDDGMRMLVLALFLLVTFSFTGLQVFVRARTDERDRPALSWASTVQVVVVFLTLAAWTTVLPKMYHDEGAVPVVYFYLIFGSVFIAHMVSYPLGVLIGCWGAKYHGQG